MMNNAVIAIYLVKLFSAVLAVMAAGCVFERPAGSVKSIRVGGR